MQWVSENTAPDSRFLLLTGSSGIMSDPIQEWFPALAQPKVRRLCKAWNGDLNQDFFPRLRSLIALQACTTLDCVSAWSASTGLSYDYLLIQKSKATSSLLNSVQWNAGFVQVYDNSGMIILQRK